MTLVEIVIVCVILGVLLRLGSVMYSKTHEKARASEARSLLGFIRTAEENYKLDKDIYTGNLADLEVEVPIDCNVDTTHFFSYSLASPTTSTFTATATRCTSGGKAPSRQPAYVVTMDQDGNLVVPEGY
ncbi:MAG: hypothetical protein NT033_09740 [Candidatus Omnitrophica bacterium]|nr:hypothetical protein [Candidatus Omnitrophota bacterium]